MKILLKLIFSIGIIFPGCPDGFYEDDCGTCWMPYCYNYISHDIQYDIDENECTGSYSMWVTPGSAGDPFFNNYCDGICPENFLADDCNSCWSSFCYTFFSPGINGDPAHSVYYDLTIEECESYGYNYYSPNHPASPYWNINCEDDSCDDIDDDDICDNEDDCIGMIDECGECNGDDSTCLEENECQSCIEICSDYIMQNYGYSEDAAYEWCISAPSEQYGCSDTCLEENEGCNIGDFNNDGNINVVDIIGIVEIITNNETPDEHIICRSDFNEDGVINVVDVVAIVNFIVNEESFNKLQNSTNATITIAGDLLSVDGNGFIQGAQLTLTHEGSINVDLTNEYIAEYYTEGNTTTLVVVTDGTKSLTDIATISGSYEITEVIIANSQSEVATQLDIQVAGIELTAAYPNPFNPSTSLDLVIPEAGFVSVKVYNLVGQEVATLAEGMMQATSGYTLTWNANNMPSGVYLVRAEGAGSVATQKLMLLK